MAVGSFNDETEGQDRVLAFRLRRCGGGRSGTAGTLIPAAAKAAPTPLGTNSTGTTDQSRRWAGCG